MENYTVSDCTKCPALTENRSQIVNGVGDLNADIVLVGEAPGETEDQDGEPFVGKSGSILDKMLEKADLKRDNIRITNTVRCRPPENRDPKESECENCKTYLIEELELVNPSVVIALGDTALKTLTDNPDMSVLKDLGEEVYSDRIGRTVVVCPHPAALIYRPTYKDDVIELLKKYS